jgi:hypothetical protein
MDLLQDAELVEYACHTWENNERGTFYRYNFVVLLENHMVDVGELQSVG